MQNKFKALKEHKLGQMVFIGSIAILLLGLGVYSSYHSKTPQEAKINPIEVLGKQQIAINTWLKSEYELQEKLNEKLSQVEKDIKDKEEELKEVQKSIEDIVKGYALMKSEYNAKGEKHTDIVVPNGKGERARTKDFVKRNCSVDVYNVFDNVYDYAESHGIKGETPFLISFADSGCGKQLKTAHNYGNVGNNDRGNTKHFSSAEKGMNAITNTLNNKYMHGMTHWWQLSGGGRIKHGAKSLCVGAKAPYLCYATTLEQNHFKNTERALTAIYENDKVKWMKFRK